MNDLTTNQIAIMKAMVSESLHTGYTPDELLWPHRMFTRVTALEYKTISIEMKGLRELKLVYFARGGMNEDGEVCGSGNGLTSMGYDNARTLFTDEELEGMGL